MSERSLTPLMSEVLFALARLRFKAEKAGFRRDRYPASANAIALEMGLDRSFPRRGNGAVGKGGWAGYMAESQSIIRPIIALRNRGYISLARRPDGKSGSADQLTAKGDQYVSQNSTEGWNKERLEAEGYDPADITEHEGIKLGEEIIVIEDNEDEGIYIDDRGVVIGFTQISAGDPTFRAQMGLPPGRERVEPIVLWNDGRDPSGIDPDYIDRF